MYRVEFAPSAARALGRLDRPEQRRLARRIDALAGEPRERGAEKLHGTDNRYRVRVGDFRIVYEIEDALLVVVVVRVGHRRDVYRQH